MKTFLKIIYNIFFWVNLLFFSSIFIFSQPSSLDYWYQTNDGFAKCAKVGEASGYATWYKDNFDVVEMTHKQGQIYAFISYSGSASTDSLGVALPEWNSTACGSAIFKHDMVENKWFKVANVNMSSAYYTQKMLTNGTDILLLANYGNIYQLDPSMPDGYRLLTSLPLKEKDFYRLSKSTSSGNLDWRSISTMEFMGDTVFFLIKTTSQDLTSNNVKEQGIIKWNYKTGTINYDSIGAFPCQLWPAYVNNDCDHFTNYMFVDHIIGRFTLFAAYRDGLNADSCWNKTSRRGEYGTVRVLWTYDLKDKAWKNISQGPDWRNLTPSGCTGTMGLYKSWDKKKYFASLQQGIYEWRGDKWQYHVVGGSYNTGPVIPVYDPKDPNDNVTFYIMNRSGVEMIDRANRINLGSNKSLFTWCVHNATDNLTTPDNGKTLYLSFDGMRYPNRCTWNNGFSAMQGIYWLQPDPDKVSPTINLHLESGTYIGAAGASNNVAIGVGVSGKHHVVVGGNFNSPVAGRFKSGWTTHNYNGATATSRAKVIQLNMFGDTIYSVTNLGNTMYDMDVQNFGSYKIVTAGEWGISVLDSSGKNLIYSKLNSDAPLNSYGTSTRAMKVDIDDAGHVVVAKNEIDFTDPSAVLQRVTLFVFDENGNQIGPSKWVGASEFPGASFSNMHMQDVVIHNDTVYVSGFNQDDLNGVHADASCNGGGEPVQSAFILAFKVTAGGWTRLWQTFGFDGDLLTRDVADTRGYHINMGKDNKLYYLGEAAGTESVYRFNGKECQCCDGDIDKPQSYLKTFDFYNQPYNTKSAHIAYFCTVDRRTGVVERGMYILPRLSDGTSNSFRISDGTVHADQKGFVYVGGRSAYAIMGRDMMHVNGKLLGNYSGGDMSIHIVNPEYTARTYWGAFNKSNDASGNIIAIGIRDNIIAAFGNTTGGKLFTGATHYDPALERSLWKDSWAMNPDPFRPAAGINDAYLAVWYQDTWNHSQQDTLQPRTYVSQPVVPETCYKNKAFFYADKTTVCVDQTLTLSNASVGDKSGWTWKFGKDASLPNGLLGKGPWTVSYSTPGLKTVYLSMQDSCNQAMWHEWPNYINVLPNDTKLTTLTGLTTACEGSKLYFSTDEIYGIESYEWSVPSGSQIIKGMGTDKIEVMVGPASGQVKVKAKYACGYTNELSQTITVTSANPTKVLLIVGDDTPISTADTKIKDRLTALGYTPWVVTDDLVTKDDAKCAGTVVISGSTNDAILGSKFLDINKPIVVLNSQLFTEMGLTGGTENANFGKIKSTQLEITNNTHDLGKSVAMGNLTVYSSTGNDTLKYAIDCGSAISWGPASDGYVYTADAGFTGTSTSPVTTTNAINNTTDDGLYQTVRTIESGSYNFNVSNGFYEVLIRFVNINNGGDICNLKIEGQSKLNNYSVKNKFGVDYAVDMYYTTTVLDGQLNLEFARYVNDRVNVAAIRILKINSPRINYGVPSSSAVSVANVVGSSSLKTVFGYDVGTKLIGYAADSVIVKERRVGLYLDLYGSNFWNTAGIQLFDNALCWCNYNCPNTVSINVANITGSLCPGRKVTINYTKTGTFNAGNRFIAQLSNASGNFGNPINIGEVTSTLDGSIEAIIPKPILTGTGYKIRIVATNPTETSGSTASFTIGGSSPAPGPIHGNELACKFQTVQKYYINKVPGATGYYWDIPLGTHFVNPIAPNKNQIITTDTTVTIDFGTGTTNAIIVRTVNGCDTSDKNSGSSKLTVYMTEYPPISPSSIAGKDTVCTNYVGTYTANPSLGAIKYQWILPAGVTAVGVDTLNNIVLNFNGASDVTNYTIGVRAIGECGNSNIRNKIIRVDNTATKPKVSNITVKPGTCPGEFIYSVVPWFGATAYTWILPTGAVGTSNTNEIYVNYALPVVNGQVKVSITDLCGTSNQKTLNVNVPLSGKNAMVYVPNSASPSTHAVSISNRLTTLGYTVSYFDGDDPAGSGLSCYDLIVVAGDNAYNVRQEIKQINVPVVSFSDDGNDGGAFRSLEMESISWYKGNNRVGKHSGTQINIVNNNHQITTGLPTGLVTVYNSSKSLVWSEAHPNATDLSKPIQGCKDSYYKPIDSNYIFAFEKGTLMWNNFSAPARRVGLFIDKGVNIGTDLNANGLKIVDQAICWATNTCPPLCPSNMITTNALTHINCNGASTGAIAITVGGGKTPYTYNWSGGGSSNTIINKGIGTYTVTVTDGNSCSNTASYTLTQPSAPLSLTNTITHVTCNAGNNGAIAVSVSGGTTNYFYSWSGGGSTNSITNKGATNYTVTVTDSKNCTLTAVFNITEPLALVATASSDDPKCVGTTLTLATSPNGMTSYSWTGPQSFSSLLQNPTRTSITTLHAGTYFVTVTNSIGCTATANVSVIINDLPTATITADRTTVTCANNSANLSVISGNTYSWSAGAITNNITVTPSSNITYTVTVTNSNGCTASSSQIILVNKTTPDATITADRTTVTCLNSSANLFVALGNSYSWSTGASTNNINVAPTSNTTYTVTVTASNGCTTTSSQLISSDGSMPDATISSATNIITCSISSINLNTAVVAGTNYLWNTNETTSSINVSPLVNTTYTVTVTASNGCTAINNKLITVDKTLPNATISASNLVITCTNPSTILSVVSGNSYSWSTSATTNSITVIPTTTTAYSVTVTGLNGCTNSSSVSITKPLNMNISGVPNNVTTSGGNDGSVNLTVVNGLTPYTYNWSNSTSNKDLSNVSGGVYTVTVSDNGGCTATSSFVIDEPGTIVINALITNVSCNGLTDGKIKVIVSGGDTPYTYSWSTLATIDSIINKGIGTYTVTVKDNNNTVKISEIQINQPLSLSISSSTTSINCKGNTGSIDISVIGGNTPYTYLWSSSENTNIISNKTAGNYTVTVTDSKMCSEIKSINLSEPNSITKTENVNHVSINGTSTGTIFLNVNGGTVPYTYLWSNSNTSAFNVGLSANTYSVTITDKNGCSLTSSTIITEPTKMIVRDSIIHVSCAGFNNGTIGVIVSGGVTPYNYSWSTGESNAILENKTTGTYSVFVSDKNGSPFIQTFTLTSPQAILLTGIQNDISCNSNNDGSISVNISGGVSPYSYTWSSGESGNTSISEINSKTMGSYTITVVDQNSCSESIEYQITKLDDLIISVEVSNINCKGDASGIININVNGGTAPYDYKWNKNEISGSRAENLIAGDYSIIISDQKNCIKTIDTIITEPKEKLTVKVNIIKPYCKETKDGEISLFVSGGEGLYNYLWSNNTSENTIKDLSFGVYQYTVRDELNCIVSEKVELKNQNGQCIIIPSAFSPNGDGINDVWKMDNLSILYKNAQISIFNRWGEEIYSSKGYLKSWDGTYKGKPLPVDSYHFIIDLGDGSKPLKGQVTIIK